MGLGTTVVILSSCGGDVAQDPPGQADGSADQGSTTDPGAGRDVSPPELPPIINPNPTSPPRSDADIDAGKHCRALVVSREHWFSGGRCPSDAGIGADGGDMLDPRLNRIDACLPAPPTGQTCSDAYDESCVLNTYECGLARSGWRVLCGPLPGPGGQCCYITEGNCPVGRPFLVDGSARLASVTSDATWAASLRPDVEALDADTRAALADVWTQDALTEHASVASFSRFVLQCLSAGAPADIVQRAARACADEIEHARIAFGLATAYAGRTIGPGPLAMADALDDNLDLSDIGCSVAAEGCIAELVSASLIAAARDGARDPAVKDALTRIAEQELDHALLAWRYLAWACATGGTHLRARVAAVFDRAPDHVGFGPRTSRAASTDAMRAHGYLPLDERRQIATSVLTNVVLPAARALLCAHPVISRSYFSG
jgi:hypothetical protein